MSADYLSFKRRIRKTGNKIDLGCGRKCQPGYVGIDAQDFGQDILWDARTGLPFPDNSIDKIFSSHFIEHLTYAEFGVLANELKRVCRADCIIELRCPHATTEEAHYHNHFSFWSEQRIRGIVKGFAGLAGKGEKYFVPVKIERAGMELVAVLKVKIK
jgi:hypothetical protein